MDSTIIYIILGCIVILNAFFLFFMMKNKGKNNATPVAPDSEVALSMPQKNEFIDEYVKTQALGSMNQPVSVPHNPNPVHQDKTEVLGGGISNLSDMEKQTIREKSLSLSSIGETVILGSTQAEPEVQAITRTIEYKENNQKKTFKWDESVVLTIGRDPRGSELTVTEDNYIGRKHALLYKKEDQYFLVDLDSRNGTFVNDEPLKGQTEVTLDQKFKLGQTEFLLK